MSIRRLQCPECAQPVNVPVQLTHVRCPACGSLWNSAISKPTPQENGGLATARVEDANSRDKPRATGEREGSGEAGRDKKHLLIVGSIVGALVGFLVMLGLVMVLVQRVQPERKPNVAKEEETVKPRIPEPYREVKMPEEQRKRIYMGYRAVARTTTEVRIRMPSSKARDSVERGLQGIQDRELVHFAALHDVPLDDILEIVKEGDAKAWDGRARSNAKRGGKRVYPQEMSEGWDPDSNRR